MSTPGNHLKPVKERASSVPAHALEGVALDTYVSLFDQDLWYFISQRIPPLLLAPSGSGGSAYSITFSG